MPKVIAEATSGKSVGGPAPTAFKSKIRVPRLDGAKMGVLATRSPHRPAPIGLSVAQVGGNAPALHRTARGHLSRFGQTFCFKHAHCHA